MLLYSRLVISGFTSPFYPFNAFDALDPFCALDIFDTMDLTLILCFQCCRSTPLSQSFDNVGGICCSLSMSLVSPCFICFESMSWMLWTHLLRGLTVALLWIHPSCFISSMLSTHAIHLMFSMSPTHSIHSALGGSICPIRSV